MFCWSCDSVPCHEAKEINNRKKLEAIHSALEKKPERRKREDYKGNGGGTQKQSSVTCETIIIAKLDIFL
jgi:hypothetical protein